MGPAALLKKLGKKERHRTGYDEDTSLMHRATAAAQFVFTADPMPLLATATRLVLDGPEAVPPGEVRTEGDAEVCFLGFVAACLCVLACTPRLRSPECMC